LIVPQIVEKGYPRVFATNATIRASLQAHRAAEPQLGYLLACHRQRGVDHQPASPRRASGIAVGLFGDAAPPVLCLSRQAAPLLLICTPILLPVVKRFGIEPVHFGIVMLLNLGIGLLTPPVGTTLFVGCAIGKVSVDEVMRGIWPFYFVMFTVLMIVTYVPWLSLALPRMFGF
jgi:hypothetical protein